MIAVGNQHRVELEGEPSWVHGLATGDGPDAVGIEPSLVVAFSIWSTPDREGAYLAIDVGRDEDITVPVYLLPFDYAEELEIWKPLLSGKPGEVGISSNYDQSTLNVSLSPTPGSTPVWMLIRDGGVVETRQGKLSVDEIRSLLQAAI
jgi:hypothetical protein